MPPVVGMIEQFAGEVEAVAGEEARREVMAGVETLKPSRREEISLWMRGAVDRLDALAGADGATVMDRCGVNCAHVNHGMTDRAKARRAKFATEEAFLQAEAKEPASGTRVELRDGFVYQLYTPATFGRPLRCFCALMSGLPADVQMSPTYCLCSRAFVRTYWTEVLGRPVDVEVVETALTGSTECRFKVSLG
jgi:predicted hydrocarbon binding protein